MTTSGNKRRGLVKFDSAKKRQKQFTILESIKKTQKKREDIQKPSGSKSIFICMHAGRMESNNVFNVGGNTGIRNPIETHGMSSSGQRLPTPMELSIHKTHRDRQVAQVLMERQLSASGYGLNNQPAANVSTHICGSTRNRIDFT